MTANGICGLTLFPGLFGTVAPRLRITEALPNLHCVRLRRRDVLGQAMSWVRSGQSPEAARAASGREKRRAKRKSELADASAGA